MPKGKLEIQQKQLDELPEHRPLILYITAPITSRDYSLRLPHLYKQFSSNSSSSSLPNGVLQRAGGKNFNFALVEVNPSMEKFEAQVSAALDQYKSASYKVVVLNAHGEREGVVIKEAEEGGGEGEKVSLTGRHFAELVTAHTHDHNLHVFVFASHGHVFSEQFYQYVQLSCPEKVKEVVAVTYFTSETAPTSWDKITTAGNGHVEVTREMGDFIKSNIEHNSPYKILEGKMKPQCVIL